jgi:hypothetical protein
VNIPTSEIVEIFTFVNIPTSEIVEIFTFVNIPTSEIVEIFTFVNIPTSEIFEIFVIFNLNFFMWPIIFRKCQSSTAKKANFTNIFKLFFQKKGNRALKTI